MNKLSDTAPRQAIIDTCVEMNRLGINQGTSGNVSRRVDDGFLITPSGVPYDAMTPEQIVQMDLDGGYLGDWLPSSEWRMHTDIYKAKPEAQAVVHTHSTYATALSTLRIDIPAFHYMIAVTGGSTLRCAEYATFGTQALADAMIEALQKRSACLLANHGVICFGPDLKKALWLAGEIETLCHQYHVARQNGEPIVLPEDEMATVIRKFGLYGMQAEELGDMAEDVLKEAPVRRDG